MENKTKTPAARTSKSANSTVVFGSEEALALTRKQIRAFLSHTNNQAVVNELEIVLKAGRDQVGWKHLGREFLAGIKEAAFAE